MKIIPVIMAGGAGTRLWPMSRDEKPKQFLNLSGNGSLLEETIRRLAPLDPEEVCVVTALKYHDLSQSELDRCGRAGAVLCEPRPRNTAAAILYAAIYAERRFGDGIMIVLPADHYIKNNAEFTRILRLAARRAETGGLGTIGIRPSYPETGYGYIKAKETAGDVRTVDRFVEKPDTATAERYVASGDYFWNSGIFIWKVSTVLAAFREYVPGQVRSFERLAAMSADAIAGSTGDVWELKKRIFDEIESISVDYAILEKASDRFVIPADFGWADLGSWKSIDDILAADQAGNRTPVPDRAIFVNADGCSVFTESKRVAVVGLADIVVVEAGGEILVINKNASQDVRKVVDILKRK